MTRSMLVLVAAALLTGCGSSMVYTDSFDVAPGDAMTIRLGGEKVRTVVTNTGDANLNLEGMHPGGETWQRKTVLFTATSFRATTNRDVHVLISNTTGNPGAFSIESKGGDDMVYEVNPDG